VKTGGRLASKAAKPSRQSSLAHSAVPDLPARRGRPGYDERQIPDIAVAGFTEHGYDATSVSALATRLGLSESAMYHRFSPKEQLLGMALDEPLGGLEGVLLENGAREGAAGERRRFFDHRFKRPERARRRPHCRARRAAHALRLPRPRDRSESSSFGARRPTPRRHPA
jgi:AcrR family transcriptional regulator